jgi:hypothetical protein
MQKNSYKSVIFEVISISAEDSRVLKCKALSGKYFPPF